MSAGRPLFGFVQFEFPWLLGPADGRYVLRGHAGVPAYVLVIETLGAIERRSRLRKPKARSAAPEPPAADVPTTRATLVGADAFTSEAEAEQWFAGLDREVEANRAIIVLNEVIHAQRTAEADPYLREVHRSQALVTRVGLGAGEQVAEGRWTDAVELPAGTVTRSHERRAAVLRPQERLAAILSGRDVALACEELTLRARLDLDAGRSREAALQLRVAFEAALTELTPWSDRRQMSERLDTLRADRAVVGAAANAALQGGLDEATLAEVERVLVAVEGALRARTQLGLE